MEKCLNAADIFPHPISFNHKHKSVFSSIYGQILSLISYMIIIFLIYYFSYDLIHFTNPKVKISQSEIDIGDIRLDQILEKISVDLDISFNCDSRNFELSDIFHQSMGLYIKNDNDNCYYNKKFSFIELNSSHQNYTYSYKFSMVMTNETDIDYNDDLKNNQISNRKFKDIRLKDFNSFYIYYSFEKPKYVKDYLITKTDISYLYYDNSLNTETLNGFSKQIRYSGSLEKDNKISIIYKIIKLETDSNYILTRINSVLIPRIDFYFEKENGFYSLPDSTLGKVLSIRFNKAMDIYTRTYKKILDLLSELGGILNPIIMLGKMLIFKVNEKKFKINILNELFTDEDISREINKHQKINENQEFDKRKITLIKNSKILYHSNYLENMKNSFKKNSLANNYNNFEFDNSSNRLLIEIEKNKKDSGSFVKKNDYAFDKLKIKSFVEENLKNTNLIVNNNYEMDANNKLNSNEKSLKNSVDQESKSPKIIELNLMKENKQLKDQEIKKKINAYLIMCNNQKNQLIAYSFRDFIISLICCRKYFNKNLQEKEDIFFKILNKLNFYFEITNIMRLFENFEKMKFILFNKNQMNCFNYMIHDINFNNKKKKEQILFDLYKYFEKNNSNYMEKHYDELIKLIMKNEIKDTIIKEKL